MALFQQIKDQLDALGEMLRDLITQREAITEEQFNQLYDTGMQVNAQMYNLSEDEKGILWNQANTIFRSINNLNPLRDTYMNYLAHVVSIEREIEEYQDIIDKVTAMSRRQATEKSRKFILDMASRLKHIGEYNLPNTIELISPELEKLNNPYLIDSVRNHFTSVNETLDNIIDAYTLAIARVNISMANSILRSFNVERYEIRRILWMVLQLRELQEVVQELEYMYTEVQNIDNFEEGIGSEIADISNQVLQTRMYNPYIYLIYRLQEPLDTIELLEMRVETASPQNVFDTQGLLNVAESTLELMLEIRVDDPNWQELTEEQLIALSQAFAYLEDRLEALIARLKELLQNIMYDDNPYE